MEAKPLTVTLTSPSQRNESRPGPENRVVTAADAVLGDSISTAFPPSAPAGAAGDGIVCKEALSGPLVSVKANPGASRAVEAGMSGRICSWSIRIGKLTPDLAVARIGTV